MLMPRKVKYRKSQKGKNRGIATRGSTLSFGEFGLKALDNGMLRSNHIEAARVGAARKMKGAGKLWINVFPSKPVTKKPAETRMGKGKGDLDHWVCPVKRGKILFEMGGIPEEFARGIFRLIAFKMPIRTKFISRLGENQ
ncbi:MAG: 50S ribosomal protein L16 [Candidatus Omnitrophica bacterium]|nr:50S ribosomal protein L16 [Candidatus Omnitrophota bacterium]